MSKLTKLFQFGIAALGSIAFSADASAATVSGVKYIDANGEEQTCPSATLVEASTSRVTWSGWYVVTNDVTIAGGADCTGAVHLILADGASLTLDKVAESYAGICPTNSYSFVVYGQAAGTGALTAIGGCNAAGIGGNGGWMASDITINGGRVTATGGDGGAGIGSGNGGMPGLNITINGGAVTAMGGRSGAGIGGGVTGDGLNITINGGTVNAIGGFDATGIGGGSTGSGSNIYAAEALHVQAGTSENPTTEIEHEGTTDLARLLEGKRYVTIAVPLTEPIRSSVTAPANATAVVYTNKVADAQYMSANGIVWSNLAATVVYTAKSGHAFADGSTVITNKLDTKVNPAVVAAGEPVPSVAGKPELKLGVVAQRYPWNGIVDVNYRAMYWPKSGSPLSEIQIALGETVFTNELGISGSSEVIDSVAIDMGEVAPETVGKAKVSVHTYIPTTSVDVQRKALPAEGGTVTGGQKCAWGTETEITAVPNKGYSFAGWSDGVQTETRKVTADGTCYQAIFCKGYVRAQILGAKQDGYPYFDQTYRFATNGIDDASSPYWDWTVNFYVSFSKKIPAKTLKLATKFEGDAEWNQSIKGDDLEAGVECEIADAGTYGDFCGKKALDFAVWAYDDQNLDTTMTVWIKMTKANETVTQKLADYKFEELVKVVIKPNGMTEETAPYAIKTGDNYYIITNHNWEVATQTDRYLTMTGLKGDETVRLNYWCLVVSNANPNTTFFAMSFPKKTSKGAYRYYPAMIPDTKFVCTGYNPVDHTFSTALSTNVIPRVTSCLNETNKFTSWWTTFPKVSYVVTRCTNLVERDWAIVSSIEYRTEAYRTHFFETKGPGGKYRPDSFYRLNVEGRRETEFIVSGEGQTMVYEASTNAVELIGNGKRLYDLNQYVDLVTNDAAYVAMNPCVKWAIDPSGSSVTFHVKSDKIPDPVEEFTLEKPFSLSQQPNRGLVGYQKLPIRVITTDPVPPSGGGWNLYDVRPVKGTITKSANEVTLTVPLDAVITCDMTVREWLKDAKTL